MKRPIEWYQELQRQAGKEFHGYMPMNTAPRNGSVIILHFGQDVSMPGWWDYPISPVKNINGTWPIEDHGYPWAFIDSQTSEENRYFINHAKDGVYGPTGWSHYEASDPLWYSPMKWWMNTQNSVSFTWFESNEVLLLWLVIAATILALSWMGLLQ